MAKRLSKKRNPLLVFEFLTREASRRVVAGDDAGGALVLAALKRAFASGTELRREYRLASSLMSARTASQAAAASALVEARTVSRSFDAAKLDAEKTRLIADVAKLDPSGALYDAQLPAYREMATVGQLVHDWRAALDGESFGRVVEYEGLLVERMTTAKPDAPAAEGEPQHTAGERRALIAIMSRKLEERWGGKLTKEQRSLLRDYALTADPSELLPRLKEAREKALACLESEPEGATDYFAGRLNEAKAALGPREICSVDDESVGLAMLCLRLVAEAEGDSRG